MLDTALARATWNDLSRSTPDYCWDLAVALRQICREG